jgi:hypothetical protein
MGNVTDCFGTLSSAALLDGQATSEKDSNVTSVSESRATRWGSLHTSQWIS